MTDKMLPAAAIRAWRKKFEGCTSDTGLEALDDLLASATEATAPEEQGESLVTDLSPEDVEAARSYVEDYLDATYAPDRTLAVARVLNALLPAPPLPTLAEMPPEEREACQWMQADTSVGRAVITWLSDNADAAALLFCTGQDAFKPFREVTPRPDLPRLEFPGEQQPAPAPPNTLTVGSVWHDVDALARACEESGRDQIVVSEHGGCIFVWDEMAEWWEGSAPPRYTPCTIIHAGREADQ